jgi:hypothetical protein
LQFAIESAIIVKRERNVIDLKSQDMAGDDLERFRKTVLRGVGKNEFEELISFNSGSKPYNFASLHEFQRNRKTIPDDASYFSYTITLQTGDRCSLYLDPDRPGKLVVDGGLEWVKKRTNDLEGEFPKGTERYVVHGAMGVFIIWAAVIILASIILLVTTLIMGLDAVIISSVIFTSSVLGIYLSFVKSKEIQPANTISFVKRRNYWLETFLHVLTIALGILSAILATIIVKSFM